MPRLSYLSIPPALTSRRQWAVSTLAPLPDGKLDKRPINPRTGLPVSVTARDEWSSFEDVVNSGYPAIGFILDEHDPFTIIDLDQTADPNDLSAQNKIYQNFHNYAERSVSGKGCHIVLEGFIGGGCRRGAIEVYDRERYMITTGDVVRAGPLTSNPILLGNLINEMGGLTSRGELPESVPATLEDEELIARASAAYNGEKFRELFHGPLPEGADRSRVDAQLAQFIAFWTKDHDQALRIFRRSAAYRPEGKGGYNTREKYEQQYLLGLTFGHAWRMLAKDNDAARVNIEHGKALANELVNGHQAPQVNGHSYEASPAREGVTFPPGMLGEIAQYIYASAYRPVAEVALAGAVAYLAALVGREYNIEGSGLNQYVVIVARTGRGKEGAASGIDRLNRAIERTLPAVSEFEGPGHIASGQALIRTLSERPGVLAVLSEFGHTLRVITDARASASDMRTRQVLLDLFSKSGAGRRLLSSAYADREKNTQTVISPNFCFLGDTTPERFYRAIETDLIQEGFMPRFVVFEYEGPRVAANPLAASLPDEHLVGKLVDLLTTVLQLRYSETAMPVAKTAEAEELLAAFDKEADAMINKDKDEIAELWNRAHLKVLRLAALVAVGVNPHVPVIDETAAAWAIGIIRGDIARLEGKVLAGEVGEGEVRQESGVVRAVKDFLSFDADQLKTYDIPAHLFYNKVIPFTYLRRRLRTLTDFKKDRRGVKAAILQAVDDALDAEILVEMPRDQVKGLGGNNKSRYFQVGSGLKG